MANKLLFQVEYDPTSIDVTHGVQFKVVYITYTINGQGRRYRPASPLRLTDLPTMAEGVSMEIYESSRLVLKIILREMHHFKFVLISMEFCLSVRERQGRMFPHKDLLHYSFLPV